MHDWKLESKDNNHVRWVCVIDFMGCWSFHEGEKAFFLFLKPHLSQKRYGSKLKINIKAKINVEDI